MKENKMLNVEELFSKALGIENPWRITGVSFDSASSIMKCNRARSSLNWRKLLKQWYFWATHSRLNPIKKVAKTKSIYFNGGGTYQDILLMFKFYAENDTLQNISIGSKEKLKSEKEVDRKSTRLNSSH